MWGLILACFDLAAIVAQLYGTVEICLHPAQFLLH